MATETKELVGVTNALCPTSDHHIWGNRGDGPVCLQCGAAGKTIVNKTKFCYVPDKYSEISYGPFDSPGDALHDAFMNGYSKATIHKCIYPDPSYYVKNVEDTNSILDAIDELAYEDGKADENGPTFEVKTSLKEANQELENLLEQWANKHLKPIWFYADTTEIKTSCREK